MAPMAYAVLPFGVGEDRLESREAIECLNAAATITRAERAEGLVRVEGTIGAVAFSRTSDPGAGEFADAIEFYRRQSVVNHRADRIARLSGRALRLEARVGLWMASRPAHFLSKPISLKFTSIRKARVSAIKLTVLKFPVVM